MIDLSKLSKDMWSSANPAHTTSGGNLASPSTGGSTDTTNWGQAAGSYNPFAGDDKYGYITQDWYRNPDWAGGAVWNPTYGWQEVNQVKNMYGGQAATDEQFNNWGLNKNLTGTWQDYYDQLGYTPVEGAGYAGGGSDGSGGTSMINFGNSPGNVKPGEWNLFGIPGQDWMNMSQEDQRAMWENAFGSEGANMLHQGGTDPYSWVGTGSLENPGGTWNGSEFGAQPSQWTTASNTLSDFANTGGYVAAPDEWYGASYGAGQMAQSGMPTDVDPWYQKAKEVSDYNTQESIKQAMEQAGLSGNRWSSGAQRTAADIGGKYALQLGAQYAQQAMGAQEAARGRQQEAFNQLYNVGSGFAGLDTAARNRQLEATGQLGGLGQYMTQYPMQLADQASQIGAQQTALEQSALDKAYQEWMRTQPEYSPYLNYAYGMATGQGTQQQYLPGAGSQMLTGISSLLPFAFFSNMFKGNS
jgi:hypothetical protein